MKKSYLDYVFDDTAGSIDTFDELPLWSAPFGMLLLKHVTLKRHVTALDIGSGAGFPLLELAERLGATSRCIGVDTWTNANGRARRKITDYGVDNVSVVEASAHNLPFNDGSVDLVVSNLGINNFQDPQTVFKECARVLKRGGRLAFTTNLRGHWKQFYTIFHNTLINLKKFHLTDSLKADENHRFTVDELSRMVALSGLKQCKVVEDSFSMRFLDGTAFLEHHFIQMGWLSDWLAIIPERDRKEVFGTLEQALNIYAARQGALELSVPMVFIEAVKE